MTRHCAGIRGPHRDRQPRSRGGARRPERARPAPRLRRGGPTIASAIIAAGLADAYSLYLAPALLGGGRLAIGDLGIPSMDAIRRLRIDGVERLGDDLHLTARDATEGTS
ncbi:hypothetical protein GCM10025881_11650 [Pseudolysinimonas kribbensis]|uniref:Bacterial bifunctional deaminase-reductase C-terminal domain-containing protein n=1 Tax=Pseudolysinimonas kribbensis TaxID=433641 RepID=A0ABQ6K6D1_9MICO|nr:hypothetical protein GCM10025881_11650 [Pseudolysinimonas kribbensis]